MMAYWQEWWIWMIAAAVLAALEVLIPGFILLGFSVGAVVTGVLLLLGLLGPSLSWTLLMFALASLAGWFALRRLAGVRRGQVRLWDRDINDN